MSYGSATKISITSAIAVMASGINTLEMPLANRSSVGNLDYMIEDVFP